MDLPAIPLEVSVVPESPIAAPEASTPSLATEGIVSVPAQQKYTPERIEHLEGIILKLPQVDIPAHHHFSPGVYIREVTMPKGVFVIGHCHKTEHFNLALKGRASVMMDGEVHHITAPAVIKSGAGVRKIFYVHEELQWATVHATTETDVSKLEDDLVAPTESFREHELHKLAESVNSN